MRSRRGSFRNSGFIALVLLGLSCVGAQVSFASADIEANNSLQDQLQSVVADLRTRLSLSAPVVVSVVPSNPLLMSVEAPADQQSPFLLQVDATFVKTLDARELEAAVAHELGHVWVFTHHPYLQTEELANKIAMRAVTRQSLEHVYDRVWRQIGTKGDLGRFLGAPTVELASDRSGQ
jgi:hypothetical protein